MGLTLLGKLGTFPFNSPIFGSALDFMGTFYYG